MNEDDLPEFDETLYDEGCCAQAIAVRSQGEFVAMIQWDGTGEFRHWVLIPKAQLSEIIAKIQEAAQ